MRSAGVVPTRNPAVLRLWNHPSHIPKIQFIHSVFSQSPGLALYHAIVRRSPSSNVVFA